MKALLLSLISFLPVLARADVVHEWNGIALDTIQRNSTPPPIAAWVLAMTHVAIHDAVNSIEPTYQPFRFSVPDSPTSSREAAASEAAFRVLWQLYPTDRTRLESARSDHLAQIADGPEKSAGIRVGGLVAAQVIAWRTNDGSQRAVAHAPATEPGLWRPTPPDFQPAMLPQWSSVTPFGIAYASQFRPAFPPKLTSAEYTRDFQEVKLLGAASSPSRKKHQTEIVHFWADGPGTVTPSGHWNQIAQTVANSRNLTIEKNARLFALLNVALADAAIVCWDMKYACNFWRPITAIHEADSDGNPQTDRDPHWRPLLDTPPFPSCTSGHSTFSGAAAQMLALFFGRDDVPFTNVSGNPRTSRTYASFSQAAKEAGQSRIYGGIHFQFDNRSGLESGRAVSRYIFARYLQPLNEAAAPNTIARTTFRPESTDATPRASAECVPVVCCDPIIYPYQLSDPLPQSTVVYHAMDAW